MTDERVVHPYSGDTQLKSCDWRATASACGGGRLVAWRGREGPGRRRRERAGPLRSRLDGEPVKHARVSSASSPRSLVLLALLPAGTLVGHGLAYGLADHHHGLPHSYLSLATWVAAPLAVAALAWVARNGATRCRSRLPVALVVAQPLLFFAQEATERILAGEPVASLFASPLLGWGLVFQVLTATILLLASAGVRRAGATIAHAWRRRRVTVGSGPDHRDPVPVRVLCTRRRSSSTSERGPPHLLVPA